MTEFLYVQRCRACNYVLRTRERARPDDVCPDCGAPMPQLKPESKPERDWEPKRRPLN